MSVSVKVIQSELHYDEDPSVLIPSLEKQKLLSPPYLLFESAYASDSGTANSLFMLAACLSISCQDNSIRVSALSKNGLKLIEKLKEYRSDIAILDVLDAFNLVFTCTPIEHNLDELSKLKQDNVLTILRFIKNSLLIEKDSPKNAFFCGGVFAHDLVASFEKMPPVTESDNICPDYCFFVSEHLLQIDHVKKTSFLLSSVFSDAVTDVVNSHRLFLECIENYKDVALDAPIAVEKPIVVSADLSDVAYKNILNGLKEHIRIGDIFQVVPSRVFSMPCYDVLSSYRNLKKTSPSPYMFYFKHDDFELFGCSPESSVRFLSDSRKISLYPIAGTRKRGLDLLDAIDDDLDSCLELELKTDPKEISEHIMLVDLARNDVAKISHSGTRKVKELLQIVKYSRVMHLYARVEGVLLDDLDGLHAYQACLNMGTLTGAPKIKANILLRQFETKRRGSYGGAIGYFNGQGDLDTSIVIRSAFVVKNVAYVQTGVGLVLDSDLDLECEESKHKAYAALNAIALAHGYSWDFERET